MEEKIYPLSLGESAWGIDKNLIWLLDIEKTVLSHKVAMFVAIVEIVIGIFCPRALIAAR